MLCGIAAASERGTRRVVGVEAHGINACPCAQGSSETARTSACSRPGSTRATSRRSSSCPDRDPQPARPRNALRGNRARPRRRGAHLRRRALDERADLRPPQASGRALRRRARTSAAALRRGLGAPRSARRARRPPPARGSRLPSLEAGELRDHPHPRRRGRALRHGRRARGELRSGEPSARQTTLADWLAPSQSCDDERLARRDVAGGETPSAADACPSRRDRVRASRWVRPVPARDRIRGRRRRSSRRRAGRTTHVSSSSAFDSPQPFDAAIACTSLHHVRDPGIVLDRLVDMLSGGGRVVVVEWAWERFDRATAEWCFARIEEGGSTWLHRHRDEWVASGREWDRYLHYFARQHGLHSAQELLGVLDERLDRRFSEDGPYFFADLRGVTDDEERAAIDAGTIHAVRSDWVGTRR